ncbi:FadR/GntR family transcriptional regulator [Celeribacter neptunius]|uniref:Transcriptional regulator, GntR family n=1 Tax=Celeribacter neptunius TaxID=588602 RepID=A0A1I3WHL1_9RHOB|nr:FCD domain-containing protein [Celeribacter neptunius]SFK05921.1 transcriptional regulator, GntR family [Celeribacter neptunius]
MPPATTRSKAEKPTEPRLSRPARVAEAIKDWVVERGMQAGDRLPSEPEMMAHFGMAKGTIREAMRILEAQGLIKTRTGPGGGSFVHEVSRTRAKALLGNYFYFKNLTIGDIYQMRRALEPENAAALAGKLSPEVLDQLAEIIALYQVPARTQDEEREQHIASLRFHAVLAEQARNPLLGFVIDFMVKLLSDITTYRQLYTPVNPELRLRGLDFQTRLLAALREGDAGAARAIMKAHMETAWALMGDQEAIALSRFLPE